MSGLIEFTHYQAEALLICLAASLVWASLLFLGARGLERTAAASSTERLWTAALLFAILPSLAAPALAAFGVSLRPAPIEFAAAPFAANSGETLRAADATANPAPLTMEQAIAAAALIYVYGVFLTFALWGARQAAIYYAVARAEWVRSEDFLRRVEGWATDLGAPMPAVGRSRHVSSVCITGVFRQTVLIPENIELRVSTDDLVLMCAHELAHVRRGDTRLFTATQLARVLFWFNPLVSRIAANVELAAEESADALVLQRGVDRRAYAACFVEGLKFAASRMNMQPALAPSFTPPDRRGRRRRLTSILSATPAKRPPLGKRLMLSAAASTVALAAVGQAAFAVDPESAAQRRKPVSDLPSSGDIASDLGETYAPSVVVSEATGDATDPHPDFDAASAIEAVDPVGSPAPAAAPEPPMDPASAAKPAPAPHPAPKAIKTIRLSYSVALAPENGGVPGVPAFADTPMALTAEDIEQRLLGAAYGEEAGSYKLTFRNGDNVYRFSSDEPMTAETRAQLREALEDMRKSHEKAHEAARKFRAESIRNREELRAGIDRARMQAADASMRGARSDVFAKDIAQIQRDTQMGRREALKAEREALAEARNDLYDEMTIDIEDALSDLDEAESDLDDENLSRDELSAARAAIRDQRSQLQRDDEIRKRAIEVSRRQIDDRIEAIDRLLDALNRRD